MLEALFLGLIQGLTEFIPVSSSAHLRIVGEFLPSAKDPGATFTAITQIGTELAVLLYFRKDILRILGAWFKRDGSSDARLGTLIIIGTLPIVALGYLGQSYIRDNFRSLWIVATMLILFGLILGLADKLGKREKTLEKLNNRDGILYGFAQSLALIPGVSRSGEKIQVASGPSACAPAWQIWLRPAKRHHHLPFAAKQCFVQWWHPSDAYQPAPWASWMACLNQF